jgi:integrase
MTFPLRFVVPPALPALAAIPALTLGEALDHYCAMMLPRVIAKHKLRVALRLFAPVAAVAADDQRAIAAAVAGWTAERRAAGRADGTIRRDLIILRAALRRAWKDGTLRHVPYVEMPPAPPGRQRWLTPEEARSLMRTITCPRTRLFCAVALFTGARRAAVAELIWRQVDFRLGVIDFRAGGDMAPRRKHRAVVPMCAPLRALLEEAQQHADAVGRGLPHHRVIQISGRYLEHNITAAAIVAGLGHVTMHVLRHTAATWLLAEDIPLPKVSAMLGHRSTVTTQMIYGHVGAVHLGGAAACLARLYSDDVGEVRDSMFAAGAAYALRDPAGTVWRGVNLIQFVRDHAGLFDAADDDDGRRIAAVRLGDLRRGRRREWKGWTRVDAEPSAGAT